MHCTFLHPGRNTALHSQSPTYKTYALPLRASSKTLSREFFLGPPTENKAILVSAFLLS